MCYDRASLVMYVVLSFFLFFDASGLLECVYRACRI